MCKNSPNFVAKHFQNQYKNHMTIKSLIDAGVKEEILARLETLTTASKAQWGKMNVAQMFAHCAHPLKLAISSKQHKLTWIGFLIGQFVRKNLYDNKPFARNLPTAPNFKVADQKDFEAEKTALISLINRFVENGYTPLEQKMHPFFGKLTAQQWAISQWKHLDHHLTQFGA